MPDPGPFAGVVLCGGASRRMGTDKALLELDGVPLGRRVARVLQAAGADPVVAAGGTSEVIDALNLPAAADLIPGGGPLSGLLGALSVLEGQHREGELGGGVLGDSARGAGETVVVVAACDLPALTTTAVLTLVRTLDDAQIAAATPVVNGRPQWSLVALRPSLGSHLREQFDAGERSMRGAFADVTVGLLELGADDVADVDTPQDWQRFLDERP